MLIFVQSKERARQLYTELAYDSSLHLFVVSRNQRGRDSLRSVALRENRGN